MTPVSLKRRHPGSGSSPLDLPSPKRKWRSIAHSADTTPSISHWKLRLFIPATSFPVNAEGVQDLYALLEKQGFARFSIDANGAGYYILFENSAEGTLLAGLCYDKLNSFSLTNDTGELRILDFQRIVESESINLHKWPAHPTGHGSASGTTREVAAAIIGTTSPALKRLRSMSASQAVSSRLIGDYDSSVEHPRPATSTQYLSQLDINLIGRTQRTARSKSLSQAASDTDIQGAHRPDVVHRRIDSYISDPDGGHVSPEVPTNTYATPATSSRPFVHPGVHASAPAGLTQRVSPFVSGRDTRNYQPILAPHPAPNGDALSSYRSLPLMDDVRMNDMLTPPPPFIVETEMTIPLNPSLGPVHSAPRLNLPYTLSVTPPGPFAPRGPHFPMDLEPDDGMLTMQPYENSFHGSSRYSPAPFHVNNPDSLLECCVKPVENRAPDLIDFMVQSAELFSRSPQTSSAEVWIRSDGAHRFKAVKLMVAKSNSPDEALYSNVPTEDQPSEAPGLSPSRSSYYRPPHLSSMPTYHEMIGLALVGAIDQKLTSTDIRKWTQTNFPDAWAFGKQPNLSAILCQHRAFKKEALNLDDPKPPYFYRLAADSKDHYINLARSLGFAIWRPGPPLSSSTGFGNGSATATTTSPQSTYPFYDEMDSTPATSLEDLDPDLGHSFFPPSSSGVAWLDDYLNSRQLQGFKYLASRRGSASENSTHLPETTSSSS